MNVLVSLALGFLAGLLGLYLYLRRLHLVVFPDRIQAPHIVPNEDPHPFWGSIKPLQKATNHEDFFMQLYTSYLKNPSVKVARIHVMFLPGAVVFDSKHMKRVMMIENYPKSVFYDTFRDFFGDGLVFTSGEKWEHHRKLLNTAFAPLYLKCLVPAFVDTTNEFIHKLEEEPGGNVSDLGEELQKLTMDIIASTGFGYDLKSIQGKAPPVEKSFSLLLKLIADPLVFLPFASKLMKWYHRKQISLIDEVIFRSIEEKRQHQQEQDNNDSNKTTEGKKRYRDILDLLLTPSSDANDTMLTREEIRDELVTFFIAGHETTALTLTWTLYLLHHNRGCLEKLVKEIDDVLRDPKDPSAPPRQPTVEDFPHFKYLTMVLKEALRIYPATTGLTRKTPDDVEFDGYTIKKGQLVFLPIYTIHHDPALWKDPHVFDPERWNEENVAASSANFFAFSHGPRNCIGQQFFWNEAKVILPMLLSHFTFTVENEGEVLPTDKTGTTKPVAPIRVKFTKRR